MAYTKWWPFTRGAAVQNGASVNGVNGHLNETEPSAEPLLAKKEKIVYIDEPNTWIINDGLLRDEGVLFGFAGTDVTEKVAAINSYYEQQKAVPLSFEKLADETLKEKAEELRGLLEELQKKEIQLQEYASVPSELSGGKVIRYLLGFTLMVVAAYGSFWLLHFYLTPLYGLWATCGIFFFGLFAQMTPISSWLQGESLPSSQSKSGRNKEYLLEVGPSVAATVLAAYLIYRQTHDWGLAIAIGLFLLFLFFFNGKLILGLCQTLVQEAKQYKKVLRGRREVKKKSAGIRVEIEQFTEKKEGLQAAINSLKEKRNDASTKVKELAEEQINKVKLFLSEYKLAQDFSSTLKPNPHE